MHNFSQLQIWQEGMSVAKAVYLVLNNFPSSEKFGLISQLSRCSISVPSNIAEGSLFELETQLQLSIDLNFLNQITSEKLMLDIIQLQKKI